MTQLAFSDIATRRPPRARRADSDGAHAAADALERSGRAAQQLAAVLDAVRKHSGSTSRELAALTGLDRHLVGRRLPELAQRGLVHRVHIAGHELKWWPRG